MSHESSNNGPVTQRELWKQFLPLSLSDITMALGDPLVSTTLAHMPGARQSLAALGIAKSQAIFFESPIIMLLHASNALASKPAARRALFKFTIGLTVFLTILIAVLCIEPVFNALSVEALGVDPAIAGNARQALLLLALWPAAIGWRRFFQGLLIHHGHGKDIGKASLTRAAVLAALLLAGYLAGISSVHLASGSLMLGVLCEMTFVIAAARKHRVFEMNFETGRHEKTTVGDVFRFYWPLANSMIVVWGGRALLVGVLAHAVDGTLVLAAWPAAWGLVLLVANSTRMVQQITIRHRAHTPARHLVQFAVSVGIAASALLALAGLSPAGPAIVSAFLGEDNALVGAALPALRICAMVPLMVAILNAVQGFLIAEGRTSRVNAATWAGTFTLLALASLLIHLGAAGATAAAIAMCSSIAMELIWLCLAYRRQVYECMWGAADGGCSGAHSGRRSLTN